MLLMTLSGRRSGNGMYFALFFDCKAVTRLHGGGGGEGIDISIARKEKMRLFSVFIRSFVR